MAWWWSRRKAETCSHFQATSFKYNNTYTSCVRLTLSILTNECKFRTHEQLNEHPEHLLQTRLHTCTHAAAQFTNKSSKAQRSLYIPPGLTLTKLTFCPEGRVHENILLSVVATTALGITQSYIQCGPFLGGKAGRARNWQPTSY
jgi:hypothetical protein